MNVDDRLGQLLRDLARDVCPVPFDTRVRRGIRRRRRRQTAVALAVAVLILTGGLAAINHETSPTRPQLVHSQPQGGPPVLSYQLLGDGQRVGVKNPLRPGYLEVPYSQAQVSPDGGSAAVLDGKGRVGVIDLEHPRRLPRWFELPSWFGVGGSPITKARALQWAPDSRQLLVNGLVDDGDGATRQGTILIRLADGAVTAVGGDSAVAASYRRADNDQPLRWTPDGQQLYTATASLDRNSAAPTSLITFFDLYGRVVRQFTAPGQLGGVVTPTTSPLSPDQHSLLGQRLIGGSPRAREVSYRWELIDVGTGRTTDLPFSVRYDYDARRDIVTRNGREPIGWYDSRHLVGIEASGGQQRLVVYDLRGVRTRVLSPIPDNVVLQLGLPER